MNKVMKEKNQNEIRQKLIDYFDFKPLDLTNRFCSAFNSNVINVEELKIKFLKTHNDCNNKELIRKFALKNSKFLYVASEDIRNDADFIFSLYKEKPSIAEFIGNKLLSNKKFLLKLNDINPIFWKYILKKHFRLATMEEKLSAFIDFYPKWILNPNEIDIGGKNIGGIIVFDILVLNELKLEDSNKETILHKIKEHNLAINDTYYTYTKEDILKDNDLAYAYYSNIKSWCDDDKEIIKKYHSDNFILAEKLCTRLPWFLNLFSSEIRNNKDLILKISDKKYSSDWLIGIADKLYDDLEFAEQLKLKDIDYYKKWQSLKNN